MNKKIIDSVLTALSISLLSGISVLGLAALKSEAAPSESAVNAKKEGNLSTDRNAIADSTRDFGLALYQKLVDAKPTENCFISPASVAIALNMTLAGAAGKTHETMIKGLKLPAGIDNSTAVRDLLSALVSDDKKVEVKIANAIFVNEKYSLNQKLQQDAKANYQSEVRNENFSQSATLGKINGWVGEKTKGHIPKILDQLNPQTAAVLLNAVFFKGLWTDPFPKQDTKDGDFHLLNGTAKKVPMMQRQGDFSYFEEKDLQAVSLPYGSERYRALVFLPSKTTKFDEFRKRFTGANWSSWTNKFTEYKNSDVKMPRFHASYSKSLNDALKLLGFENMYSGEANFSPMHTPPPPLVVSDVIHKATLDVDEEGTVATAATGVSMMPMAMAMKPKRFEMIVDRPFIFAIQDSRSGTLLFFGSITNPESK